MTEYPSLHPCRCCLRVTRPSKHKPDMYPFPTVVRVTGDLCGRCSDEINRATPPMQESPELTHTVRGLLRYLAGRQQRLARSVTK